MSEQASEPPQLSGLEERVLKLMTGLADGRRYTLAEVARRLGVGDDRIIEILQSAKRKLGPPPP
jgi:DNA-directed RNA polymerase sigma subunit (sigma70/sigma32)